MKKFLFLFAVIMCVGLCSCTINVNEKPRDDTGKIKVVYELNDRYEGDETHKEVIEKVWIIDSDTGKTSIVYDEDIKKGKGYTFKVDPGRYYVKISVYNKWYEDYYTYRTERMRIKSGSTHEAVYDGEFFEFKY